MRGRSNEDKLAETIIKAIKEKRPQTVRELVEYLKEDFAISEEKIVEYVLNLEREGKIRLKEPVQTVRQSFSLYLTTEKARGYWITIVVAAATTFVLFTVSGNMFPLVYIRQLLGAVFALWLPGYTLGKVLFPARQGDSSESLDFAERVALSIGLSLALVTLTGLLLNYTPWGIRLTPITLSLLVLSTAFATAAAIREYRNALESLKHDGLHT